MQLEGRVVVVTGGGRALGRSYCLGLAAEGARVVVADLIDPQPVVEEITRMGGDAVGFRFDIRSFDDCAGMVRDTLGRWGKIDALINNAAYFRDAARGGFEDVPISEIEKTLSVNILGTWIMTKAVVPAMRSAGSGKIINVSSASVYKGISATGPHYLTSKAAIIGFSRALARELGPDNISVNTLVPDAIPEGEEALGRAIDARCFRRRQLPEDMLGTVIYLCGGGSDFVTGQSFHVNGGSYFV